MPLLFVGEKYSINMKWQERITEMFLRHVPHGNVFYFKNISETRGFTGRNIKILSFVCESCKQTIENPIPTQYLEDELIKFYRDEDAPNEDALGVYISQMLLGKDVSIAYLEPCGHKISCVVNPNRSFLLMKLGLTKDF